MNECRHCSSTALNKAGRNASGSQRFQCKQCHRHTTFAPQPKGYADALHQQALQLYLAGKGVRSIGRLLRVTYQTVANWLQETERHLAATPQPPTTETLELDELFTFVGEKKTPSIS